MTASRRVDRFATRVSSVVCVSDVDRSPHHGAARVNGRITEMGWAACDYRFCWSGRFRMAELGVLEHPVQKFGFCVNVWTQDILDGLSSGDV